jgi:exosome complex RNA-binding protein Rrp42 (RNase PH superfamily)
MIFRFSVTICYSCLLSDPNGEEEDLCDSIISVFYNNHNQLCSIHKSGGVSISNQILTQCFKLAAERNKELIDLIEQAVQQYQKQGQQQQKQGQQQQQQQQKSLPKQKK